ncbi:MAG TPA: type II secretion system protein GspC [Kofleriaceae bacterium]|jgi:hypothetical protein
MLGHQLQRALVRAPILPVVAMACAALAASAASSVISAAYFPPATSGPPAPALQTAAPVKPAHAKRDGRDFVARDLFCSSCSPPIAADVGPDDSYTPEGVLIATIIGADLRCTVRAISTAAQGNYGVGDRIPGVGTVTRIGWRSIGLADDQGRHGRLDLLDNVAAARSDEGAATPDAAAAAPPPWAGKIKKIDDHTFEVDRSLVRELVSGAAKPGGTRVLPRMENGKMTGMRLFAVKEDSLAGALGLKNADVMSGINNVPITSLQTMLDVYTKIDSLNVVEIAGERAGQPITWTLRLQ